MKKTSISHKETMEKVLKQLEAALNVHRPVFQFIEILGKIIKKA